MKKQQRLATTNMIRQQAQKRHTVRRRYALNLNIIWRAGIFSTLTTEKTAQTQAATRIKPYNANGPILKDATGEMLRYEVVVFVDVGKMQ
ncbi:hypothetical protein ACTP13_00700 [Paenibacillus peoriae]|uniref:hypothetical protein n=1 Tax=Paenibacillus peoriae TaxID=59893 RepID=UPI003F9983B8